MIHRERCFELLATKLSCICWSLTVEVEAARVHDTLAEVRVRREARLRREREAERCQNRAHRGGGEQRWDGPAEVRGATRGERGHER